MCGTIYRCRALDATTSAQLTRTQHQCLYPDN